MKYTIAISVVAAAMLIFAPVTSDAGKGGAQKSSGAPPVERSVAPDQSQDKTRMRDPDRVREQDKDRIRDQDQDQDMDKDRIRDRDRIHSKDPMQLTDQDIYGGALMTVEERNRYRRELKAAKTRKAREEFQLKHEKLMRERAAKQGQDLVPPGQGRIYGSELMTVQERNEYRERMRLYAAGEGLEEFQAQHREEMRKRALELGTNIEEVQ